MESVLSASDDKLNEFDINLNLEDTSSVSSDHVVHPIKKKGHAVRGVDYGIDLITKGRDRKHHGYKPN